ncbi:MAG TPA: hypothetical protein VGE55_13200 [Limnobacter sp.]|uniref:hypothetical protein n=1 Tax=Limnobacter sp. TaxID=2003368 RepID=UPI002EDB05DD
MQGTIYQYTALGVSAFSNLSPQEFDAWDANHDHVISREEFRAYLLDFLKKQGINIDPSDPSFLENLLKVFDKYSSLDGKAGASSKEFEGSNSAMHQFSGKVFEAARAELKNLAKTGGVPLTSTNWQQVLASLGFSQEEIAAISGLGDFSTLRGLSVDDLKAKLPDRFKPLAQILFWVLNPTDLDRDALINAGLPPSTADALISQLGQGGPIKSTAVAYLALLGFLPLAGDRQFSATVKTAAPGMTLQDMFGIKVPEDVKNRDTVVNLIASKLGLSPQDILSNPAILSGRILDLATMRKLGFTEEEIAGLVAKFKAGHPDAKANINLEGGKTVPISDFITVDYLLDLAKSGDLQVDPKTSAFVLKPGFVGVNPPVNPGVDPNFIRCHNELVHRIQTNDPQWKNQRTFTAQQLFNKRGIPTWQGELIIRLYGSGDPPVVSDDVINTMTLFGLLYSPQTNEPWRDQVLTPAAMKFLLGMTNLPEDQKNKIMELTQQYFDANTKYRGGDSWDEFNNAHNELRSKAAELGIMAWIKNGVPVGRAYTPG